MKSSIKRIFYGIGLFLLALFMLPKFLYQCIFHKKYRRNWKQRFGFSVPHDIPAGKTIIWVHAVSVGEAKAIIPLIKKLHRDDIHWVFSSTTETGFDEVARSLKLPVTQLFMPLDFKWIIKPLMKQVNPSLILISETDLWFNFLSEAKDNNIPVALVNGKISERSANRLSKVPFFTRDLLDLIDLYCVQSKVYAERFEKLGVSRDKIFVTGNLKWDQVIRPLADPLEFRKQWRIEQSDRVLVLGSTHPAEEQLILDRLVPVLHKHPSWKLLVVPRHPERFESVRALIANYNSPQLILIDQMGILTDCYQIAELVILGGSFVPGVGGHNILEPSQVSVGVLFGPHMHNQEDMVYHVLDAHAGFQLPLESVPLIVDRLIKNQEEAQALGAAGKQLHAQLVGAADRTEQHLKRL